MNKALMVSIQSKWLNMILNGKKTFEFRNWKVEKGTVIYFYCTKAKPYLTRMDSFRDCSKYMLFANEVDTTLNGKVVAKSVVKKVWKHYTSNHNTRFYRTRNSIVVM